MYDDQLYGQLAVATGMITAEQLQAATSECLAAPPEHRLSLRLMLIRGGWLSAEDDALLQQRTLQMQAAPTLDLPKTAQALAFDVETMASPAAPLDTPGEVRRSGPQSDNVTFDALGATTAPPPPSSVPAPQHRAHHAAAQMRAHPTPGPAASERPDGLYDTQQNTIFTVESGADPIHREVDPIHDPRSTSMPILATGEIPAAQLRMPKYAQQRMLGRGGMGEVALAVDRDLRREVAVKTLLRPDDPAVRSQFIEEAQVTGQLEHPNIVPIHELGTDANDRPFIVMKRVKGRSLHEILQGMAAGRGSGLHDINRSPSSSRDATVASSESGRYSRASGDSLAKHGRLSRMRSTTEPKPTRTQADDANTPAVQLAKMLPVFLKICDALAYAHARNVVHRDLKPENIMIGEFGEVLVMDWGLAKVLGKKPGSGAVAIDEMISTTRQDAGADAARTVDGTIKGTPAYMAPEQAMGDVGKIDQRTDVYALGAVMYEMLTLKPPYEGRSVLAVLAAVGKGDLTPPSERTPGRMIPRELESVILKAMQRSPAKRYQTVMALKADIEAYMAGRALKAATYSSLQLLGKWARRNRLKVAMMAIVLVMLVGAAFGMVQAAEFAREQERIAKETEIDGKLDAMTMDLDAVRAELTSIESAISAAQFESAIARCDAFMDEHNDVLERLRTSDTLRERRVDVYQAAMAMPDEVTRVRDQAIREWCRHTLEAIVVDPVIATEARRNAASAAFEQFKPYLAEPRLADLQVADFAVWLASVGFAADDEVEGSKWVAEAYIAQPDAEATGRGFLLLADYSMNRRYAADRAAIQYEMALSQFAKRHPALRPHALLGLTIAVANLQYRPAPVDTSLSSRTVALRCLLKLITPQGELRDDVRAVLTDAEAARIQKLACNHLVALRRSTFGVSAPVVSAVDYDNDGERDCLLVRRSRNQFEFCHARRPDSAGEALPTLEPFAEFDLTAAIERLAADVDEQPQHNGRIWVDYIFEGTTQPQVAFALSPRLENAADCVFAIYAEPNALVPAFAMRVPHAPRDILIADLDRDGFKDIVFQYSLDWRGAWVCFGEPNRRFTPLIQLTDRVGGRGSIVDHLSFEDLNDDGEPELLLHLSIWNDFSLEVIDVRPNRTFARRAFLRVGRTPVRTVRIGDQTYIAIAAGISEAHERFFEIVGEPVPPLGMQLLRYDGSSLERIPLLNTPFNPDDLGVFQGRFVDEFGREALLLFGALPGNARGVGIYFFDSFDRIDAVPLGVVEHRGIELSTFGKGWYNGSGRFCHYLTNDDLTAIAALPLPEQAAVERSASVELARFMLDAGLVAKAAEYATSARVVAQTDEIANELLRIELQARLSLRQYREVQNLLTSLTPSGSLLPDVLLAAEMVATQLRDYGFARSLYNDWSASSALTAMQRDELLMRARVWKQLADDLGAPVVEWRGTKVYLRGEEQGPIGDYLLTTDLDIIDLDADADGAFTLRGHGRRSRLFVGPDAELNMSAGIHPYEAACGVPLRFDGGSFRLVIDARMVSVPWNARMRLGVFPIDRMFNPATPSSLAQGVSFWTTGGNEIYRLGASATGGSAAIDEKMGQWLRFDIEYVAHQRTISFAVHDLRNRQALVYEVRDTTTDPLRGGTYVLGLGGSFEDFPAEVQIRRVTLFGACELIEPGANEIRALEMFRPDVAAYSQAARAWLEARYADAEAALLNYARVVERALQTADADSRQQFSHEPQRLRMLAAWYGSGGDAESFAERLSPLVTRVADVPLLLETLLARPGSSLPDDLLAGAGQVVAAVTMPGSDVRAVRNELEQRLRTGQGLQEVDFLIAAWVFDELGDTPQTRAIRLFSMAMPLDAAARQGLSGLPFRQYTVLTHFLHTVETSNLSAAERENLRFVRGTALTNVMRRRDAIAVMESGNGPAIFGTAYERHRRIADRRRDELEENARRARERSVPFTSMPDED